MDAKTEKILGIFEEINTIPRKSKNEEKISNWLVEWGKSHGFDVKQDKALNVCIPVPATAGRENDPTVILQGHMDMVCEKTPDSPHDFSKDPIKHIIDGEWMHADKTTLGSDNGIGIAMALELATDDSISRPPLELLFTSDEETGLFGAKSIESDFISGKILLNLDSEDEGVFTIGCAGGRDVEIKLNLNKESPDTQGPCFKLSVDGLKGGHSGIDIQEPRENANIVVARLLRYISKDVESIRLVDIAGGSAHNAIPRNAYVVVTVPASDQGAFKDAFINAASKLEKLAKPYDPEIKISISEADAGKQPCTVEDTTKVISLLNALPHGVTRMSVDIEGLVETSNNFATMGLENGVLTVLSSQRSSIETQLEYIVSKVEAVGELAGAAYVTNEGYPGWEPNPKSKILALCKNVYKELYGKEPHVEAIHAGLECGLIGAKFDGMDMISFGPTLKNPHSPNEKLHLPSLPKVWAFIVELLKAIK